MTQRVTPGHEIAVPASTSNLGAGFDALGLALQLFLRVRVLAVEDDGAGRLACEFENGAPDGGNYVERGWHAAAERTGRQAPSLTVRIASEIPPRSGLGSSAAALVAGIRLFADAAGGLPLQQQLDLATSLEGHPDNVSAALLGGLTVSTTVNGRTLSIASPWPEELRLLVATPACPLDTPAARGVLPRQLAREDAVFNLQRAALLVQALHQRRFEALRAATDDRLHQPFRAPLVPCLTEALALDHPAIVAAFLSGAGPSIALIVRGDAGGARLGLETLYQQRALPCTIRELTVQQPFEV